LVLGAPGQFSLLECKSRQYKALLNGLQIPLQNTEMPFGHVGSKGKGCSNNLELLKTA
jgi:hypothetical protein